MCLQDLKIARRIRVRIVGNLPFVGEQLVIAPSPDRYGISFPDIGQCMMFAQTFDGGLAVVPCQYQHNSPGVGTVYTDLSIFPGLNQVTILVSNPWGGPLARMVEQYYDPELSTAAAGEL